MWRLVFPASLLMSAAASAQSGAIPGRDLLDFPIALAAEAPALGTQAGTGLWNPATALIPEGSRWRLAVAAMNAPADVSVSAQVAAAAGVWRRTTIGVSVVQAGVGNLLRTDTDPQSIGDEIPYSTLLLTAFAARRLSPHLVAGLAVRNRSGRMDNVSRSGASMDAGIIADHLTRFDAQVGASTFLWHPGDAGRERASYLLAADVRVAGRDSTRAVRAGYSLNRTQALSTEHYFYATGRWGRWELRGGPLRTEIYGESNWRLRIGVAVRHAGYSLGVAREESASGLAPTYQFLLSSALK